MKHTCLHSSALVVLLVLTATTSTTAGTDQHQRRNNDQTIDINLSLVDLHNDLHPNSSRLFVSGSFTAQETEIVPGTSYTFFPSMSQKATCFFIIDKICADCLVFDPNVDYKEHHIYWSVRMDGIYRSLDRTNWDKKYSWQPIDKCL